MRRPDLRRQSGALRRAQLLAIRRLHEACREHKGFGCCALDHESQEASLKIAEAALKEAVKAAWNAALERVARLHETHRVSHESGIGVSRWSVRKVDPPEKLDKNQETWAARVRLMKKGGERA